MLALLGALREEISGLRKGVLLEEVSTQQDYCLYRGKYRNKAVLLAQTGLGRERSERVTQFILERYPVTALVSLGFAGALTGESRIGDIILCSTLYCGNGQVNKKTRSENQYHSDVSLVSRSLQYVGNTATRLRQGKSVTVTRPVLKPEAKEALGKAFRADIVDMESYWIARVASVKQIPFLAVRAVSDTIQDSLLPFDQILGSNGRWRWHKAVPYFLFHPEYLIKLFTLYRNAQQARKSLTIIIDHLVANL